MQNTVNFIAAFFRNEADAENAIRDLKQAGFHSNQIGTSLEDYDLEHERRSRGERGFWDKITDFFSGDTGYEDRDTGSGEGYRKEGLAVGRTLTIPEQYRDRMRAGGVFVSVHGANAPQAEQILIRNHGEIERDLSSFQAADTAERMEKRPSDRMAEKPRGAEGFADQGHRIQLLSEVLRVRKDRVQRGEVRLRKEVITETQNVQVPVTREELVVERTPGEGRPATGEIGAEKEIRVPLSEERASVEKVPVVREEVRVGKRAVEDTRNIADKTRREELQVEKEGDVHELDESEISKPKRKKTA